MGMVECWMMIDRWVVNGFIEVSCSCSFRTTHSNKSPHKIICNLTKSDREACYCDWICKFNDMAGKWYNPMRLQWGWKERYKLCSAEFCLIFNQMANRPRSPSTCVIKRCSGKVESEVGEGRRKFLRGIGKVMAARANTFHQLLPKRQPPLHKTWHNLFHPRLLLRSKTY